MKKLLQTAMIAALALPTFAFAETAQVAKGKTTQAPVSDGKVTVVSPRTGIQYSIDNPKQRPVTIQTEAIAPVTSSNADRIVASNPALSPESQEKAKQALLAIK
jgi:hypothetical protein